MNSIFDSYVPKLSYASHENLLSMGSKLKIPNDIDDLRARQIRWKQINCDQRLQHGSPTTEIAAPPLPLRDASATCMLCSWGNPLYFCPNLCAYVCLYVSVYVCVYVCMCDPQDRGLDARAKPGQLPALFPKQSTLSAKKVFFGKRKNKINLSINGNSS